MGAGVEGLAGIGGEGDIAGWMDPASGVASLGDRGRARGRLAGEFARFA